MIERVVKYKDKVTQVCLDYHISRPSFYKWLKRYQEIPQEKRLEAMRHRKPKVERYYQQTPKLYKQAVLDVVSHYPQFGVERIAQVLPKIAGKPIVGYHGVQKILERYSLNTYEQRVAYAKAQITPVIRLISALEDLGTRFIILPTETRVRIIRFATATFFTAFATTVVLGFAGYMATIAAGIPVPARVGLFFATFALSVGSIFFAYSMKYYLTLAIVLSFSRQPLEEGGGYAVGLNGRLNGNQRNGNGGNWLQRVFGIGNGNGNGRREVVPAGGLQPSLEHIKLKRYPFVSIHLPFYNEKKVAERILEACTSMDYPSYEIVVCDDSTDETIKIVQKYAKEHNQKYPHGPKIKVLHRPTREGFKGGALKYAVKHMDSRTEFCVVFDADFIPYPDTLELFIKYFKANNNNNNSEDYTKSNVAVVGGYQWHVLNKSENWVTRGVRTEYAGSYVIERPGREIMGLLKQISGSVYMIRADLLKKIGWGTSITEDFELTLKLYERGYKVIYTPYIQGPAECVSTLKRLVRQRMRWAEGHSHCIKRMFVKLMLSPKLTLMEKLEVLYISPYYLQAFFFLVGTFCWLMAETVFRARLPFWTSLWGWSLVLTNFFSLPLMNAVGLFLEESEEKDYLGLFSFVALSYIMVPFQAYASIKGFIEKQEGPWFRTPKTGRITDIFTRGKFYRWIAGILPGRRPAPAVAPAGISASISSLISANPYVALATANNQFNNFTIRPKRLRWISKTVLVGLLIMAITIFSSAQRVAFATSPPDPQGPFFLDSIDAGLLSTTEWKLVDNDNTGLTDTSTTRVNAHNKNVSVGWYQYPPGNTNVYTPEVATTCAGISPDGRGWIFPTPFGPGGYTDLGNWVFRFDETDNRSGHTGHLDVCVWRVIISGGSIQNWDIIYSSAADGGWNTSTDIWDGLNNNTTRTATNVPKEEFGSLGSSEYLYVEYFNHITVVDNTGGPSDYYSTFRVGGPSTNYPNIDPPVMKIPEKVVFLMAAVPFIPLVVLWMRKRKALLVNNEL